MADIEPIGLPVASRAGVVTFDRRELDRILDLYGRMVALGEWRDYAIDFTRDRAVFSIFRRAAEVPIYRIEKDPRLARRHHDPRRSLLRSPRPRAAWPASARTRLLLSSTTWTGSR